MTHPQITACAVIGREDQILLVRRSGGGWTLPGTRVAPDEQVETALDRGLRDMLGANISSASFLCLVEDPDGLFIVFDVTTDTEGHFRGANQPEYTWTELNNLTSLELHPAALRNVLQVGDPPVWLPHHPT